MADWPGVVQRDLIAQEFRFMTQDQYGWAPFLHQADWLAAVDGLDLVPGSHENPDVILRDWLAEGNEIDPHLKPRLSYPSRVTFGDGTTFWLTRGSDKSLFYSAVRRRERGVARVVACLGAFKGGKSDGTGLFLASHAHVDGLRVDLVGDQYSTSEGEFDSMKRFLFSERGWNLKGEWAFQPKQGKCHVIVDGSDAQFVSRTWREALSLEGKERDGYVYVEAYQLPGIEVYDDLSQNLDARDGFAIFPTTRKRPWVEIFHEHGHGTDEDFYHWHCSCGFDRAENPYTHNERTRKTAERTMTREKFAVHWKGQAGTWIGSVYEYSVGDRIWQPDGDILRGPIDETLSQEEAIAKHLRIPDRWMCVAGIDLGKHHAAGFVAFDELGHSHIVAEVLNYEYTAGQIEFLPGTEGSYETWARNVLQLESILGGTWHFVGDLNLQMRRDLATAYGIYVGDGIPELKLRTDITRSYFQHDRVKIAPWVKTLQLELQWAKFPEQKGTTDTGKRMKGRDHGLDTVEHAHGIRGVGDADQEADREGPDFALVHPPAPPDGYPGVADRSMDPHLGAT